MPLPKVILVPTDFGEPSEAALDYAIDLAEVARAEIVLVHAYQIPIVGFPDGAVVVTAELTARVLEGAQTALERQMKSRDGRGVPIRGLVKQGDAHHVVEETAKDVGADLIVMGTHGRSGIPRILLGSVAEKVVRTAKVPVLTVHGRDDTREEARGPRAVRPGVNGDEGTTRRS